MRLSQRFARVLGNPDEAAFLGQAARSLIKERYDLAEICLPRRSRFIEGFGGSEPFLGNPELSRAG